MLVPVVFQSFYCNSSTILLDGQQTLLKLSADSWEELNAVKTPSKPKCRCSWLFCGLAPVRGVYTVTLLDHEAVNVSFMNEPLIAQ